MPTTHDPITALRQCADALTPPRNGEEADARISALEALRTLGVQDEVSQPVAFGPSSMARGLYDWLVEEMGMEPEPVGAGSVMLRHECSTGAFVLVSDRGGSGLPSWDDWNVCAYPKMDGDVAEPMFALMSEPGRSPLTLRQAVSAACSVAAEYAPAEPVAPLELGAALVRDALALLDVVEHTDDSAMQDGKLRVITEDGRVLRVSVEVLESGK